jgi:DHA1 family multidrug resistance protein-like MFS transporter
MVRRNNSKLRKFGLPVMNTFIAIVFASLLSRLGYQMARTPVLPIFAADLGAMPELIGVIVAASTITGVFFKLPSGALSDVLGRKRMMVLGALFFAAAPFLYPFVNDPVLIQEQSQLGSSGTSTSAE